MRNKKGFTLVELLAVIAIIAIISLVAIPNIVGLSTDVRKDQMLDDAKKLISLAKYQVNKSYAIRANPPKTFTFSELNINGDIEKDPDGGNYDQANSYVKYSVVGEKEHYCIVLIGSRRKIGNLPDDCIDSENLHARTNVVDIE